ncbi:conserved hypothetical protein [Burkholderia pseudomallei Pakistan 9]|nr:hypothetical protein BURPSS13_P0971 [Burkholderia pseudomallei S13]EEC35719.1 conserved hypothetical protein [Burkholderia pseudomallei 576]EEH26675.1 conserved hypothetical protein [Burkholderia pseudomallei Pakistan 9]
MIGCARAPRFMHVIADAIVALRRDPDCGPDCDRNPPLAASAG